MKLSVAILVLIPMLFDVVYSDESTREISSVLELFPEFVQVKDEMKQLEKGHLQIKDKIKEVEKELAELTPSGQCPPAFARFENRCYLYIPVEASWIEAQMYCRVFGGSLMSIETYEELSAFDRYLRLLNEPYALWIDGTDLLYEGIWRWTNGNGGQEMIRSVGMGLWRDGEPNDKDDKEDCLLLSRRNGPYLGNDFDCTAKLPFMCEAY